MSTFSSTSFIWSNPPVQVYIDTKSIPVIYWRNRNSSKIFSFPLTVDIKQEDVPKIAYLVRRYYADHMRKFLQEQITGSNKSLSSLSERLQISACLPIKVLDLNNNINITNINLINGGKLINWFIYIISLIFSPKSLNVNETFYIRNENVGVGTMKIDDIIKQILNIYTVALSNTETESILVGGGGEGILSLSNLFKLLSDKILKILKTGHKNGQKLKTKKGGMAMAAAAATTGKGRGGGLGSRNNGTDNDDCDYIFDTQLENELRNCVTGVEDRIKMFNNAISFSVTNESNTNTWAVKQFIKQIYQQQPGEIEPIYLNINITFRTMFHAVGEIMNTVCLEIMPQLSMADALGSSIFHILYLKDLNLLESFAEQINLPILTRLINACFVDNNNINNTIISNYKNSSSSLIIYDILSSLPSLCSNEYELHDWITMNEEKYIQGIQNMVTYLLDSKTTVTTTTRTGINEEELYYLINHIRKCTIEYYTIRLICHYVMALTISGSGKHVKCLNKKNLISCLYRITACVYHYVRTLPTHLLNVNILTDNTFGSNPVYKKIIHKALEDFLCINIPLLSE